MDKREIRAATAVRTVHYRPVMTSTSDVAAELLASPVDLPLLVIADEQTAGRGRSGNRWWSASGALMLTLAWQRTDSGDTLPPYSLLAGLAVRAAVQQLVPAAAVQVKWPNDVFLDNRKVCGILVEIPPARSDALLIGIGINVNNSFADAPASLRDRGTSLFDATGQTFERMSVLTSVLNHVTAELQQATPPDELPSRWQPHCALTGREVGIRRGDRVDRGLCLGITGAGALRLSTPDGELAVPSGVVCHIGPRT